MITTINDLQSSYSFGEYVKQYIDSTVSPLANAGQRFGINATGVKYVNKTCADIFNLNDYDINNHILELHLSEDSLENIKIINKTNNSYANLFTNNQEQVTFSRKLTIKDILDNDNIAKLIAFGFKDIDEISDESYIIIDNFLFTGFIKGKLNGNSENNNCKLIYFQYDIEHNKLLHYIVTKYFGTLEENNDWYIVYELNNKDHLNYVLSIYLYRLEWLTEYINNDLGYEEDEYINYYSNLISSFYNFNASNTTLSFFKDTFVDYSYFRYNSSEYIDDISFLNYIFTFDYTKLNEERLHKFKDINITVENNIFSGNDILSNIYSDYSNDILGYISKDELSLFFINLQNIYSIYYQLYIYYNQATYFNSNNNEYVYKFIIYSLFEYFRKEYNVSDTKVDKLYIPLSYTFNCFVSDLNEAKLYAIDNIYVKFLNDYNVNINDLKNQIYYIYARLSNHTSIYKIHINYNQSSEDIVNGIIINKLYTLPYINALNNWVIDDQDTSFSVLQNKYSGVKELYIYNSNISNSEDTDIELNKIYTKILNISENEIEKNINNSSILEYFRVNPKYFTKYNTSNISCPIKLPNLTNISNDFIEFFKNTIIIGICNINLLDEQYREDYGLDYIYSLWYFNEYVDENNETKYKFSLISLDNKTTDNPIAFDPFNNSSIVNKSQQYQYIQSLSTSNKFDTNSSSVITDNVNLVIRNKNGMQYRSDYHNDYNAILEYIPERDIQLNGNDPIYRNKKYINSISELNTTNVLYPVYDFIIQYTSEEELKNILTEVQNPYFKTYITIDITSDNKLVTELTTTKDINTILKIVKEKVTEYKSIEIGISRNNSLSSSLNFYNEYVFDNNVPTIDHKEAFLRNVNTLNRVNILGLSYNDNIDNKDISIYNGFIGTKFTDIDKNTLYISTSNKNINIGNDTLLNNTESEKFNKYDTFQIDEFENINLNSNDNLNLQSNNINVSTQTLNVNSNNICISNEVITKKENGSNIIYSTSIIPQGNINKHIYITSDIDKENNIEDNLNHLIAHIIDSNTFNNLFIPIYGIWMPKFFDYNKLFKNDTQVLNYINSFETSQFSLYTNIYSYFYNSINITKLLKSTFGDILFNNEYKEYTTKYICNSNNLLQINIGTQLRPNIYYLLVFNDQTSDLLKLSKNTKNSYHIINHKLNITAHINTNSKTINIYINFENDNIDNLNKSISLDYSLSYNNGIGRYDVTYNTSIGTMDIIGPDNVTSDDFDINPLSLHYIINAFNRYISNDEEVTLEYQIHNK